MADDHLIDRVSALEAELRQAHAREETLEDLLEKKLNEIYVHYHISRTIGSIDNLQEMLQQVIDIIKKALPCDRVSVYLLNEELEQLELVFFNGPGPARRVLLPVGVGTPGRIAESGEHVHFHDLSIFYETFNDFIHHPDEEKRSGSYIGIALKVHNATIGIIGIDNQTRYGLSVDDMDFMAILSHQIAAGVEKSLLFEKIQKISQHDGLTGLYNYRMFQEKLVQEINRRSRSRKPLALMMLDIDHFKRFNDTYGHQAGDAVLRELSKIIISQTRCGSIDICCRYGGEEFAVIMPELDLVQAGKVAERLRKTVEETQIATGNRIVHDRVTISLGVACIEGEDDLSPEELIKKTDDALYWSKRNGRNRVSWSPKEK